MRVYLSPGFGRVRFGHSNFFDRLRFEGRDLLFIHTLSNCVLIFSQLSFLISYSPSAFPSLLLTASGISSHQHTLCIRLTVMESPLRPFFSLSPFFYLQSCDGTVCPDHVGLCIIFTQIYPTMTNAPIIPEVTRRIIVRFTAASSDSR